MGNIPSTALETKPLAKNESLGHKLYSTYLYGVVYYNLAHII